MQRNQILKMLSTPEEIRMEYLGIEKTKPSGAHIINCFSLIYFALLMFNFAFGFLFIFNFQILQQE